MGEVRHNPPFAVLLVAVVLHMAHTALGNTDVRHDQYVQHQVGDDYKRHTQAGSNGEVTDNVDFDEHQGQEAHGIGNQRQHARDIQGTECQAGCSDSIKALGRFHSHGVNNLYAVADTDRKHQERHQHRVRVQSIAQKPESTQLPEHSDDGGQHRDQRAGDAAGIPEQQQRGQQDGDAGKPGNGTDTFNQVAHFLGKANDVDADFRVLLLVFAANLFFQLLGERGVIQRLAGFRVGLVQRRVHNRRTEVV